jgi:hypothetical protein
VKVLHIYKRVDVPGTDLVRYVVYELSHVVVRRDGEESVIPKEVWSTGTVSFYDTDGLNKKQRQVFEETCRRNGARPRRATFQESISLAAELREMTHHGVYS